jgi:hypothetical protein
MISGTPRHLRLQVYTLPNYAFTTLFFLRDGPTLRVSITSLVTNPTSKQVMHIQTSLLRDGQTLGFQLLWFKKSKSKQAMHLQTALLRDGQTLWLRLFLW